MTGSTRHSFANLLELAQLGIRPEARDLPVTHEALARELQLSGTAHTVQSKRLWKRFHAVSAAWPIKCQWVLVDALEAIVTAERFATIGRSRAVDEESRLLATNVIRATDMVTGLFKQFPRPTAASSLLIRLLADFIEAAANEARSLSFEFPRQIAREAINALGVDPSSAELKRADLAKLVDLALGSARGPVRFETRNLQRSYLGKRKPRAEATVARQWARALARIGSITAQTSTLSISPEDFYELFRESLHGEEPKFSSRFAEDMRSLRSLKSPNGGNDSANVREKALTWRAEMTRKLQAAKLRSPAIFNAELRAVIGEGFPALSSTGRDQLLARIIPKYGSVVAASLRPSAIAARLAAERYGLPVRQVRTGRPTQPLPRTRVRVGLISFSDEVEHGQEARRRGRAARRGDHQLD